MGRWPGSKLMVKSLRSEGVKKGEEGRETGGLGSRRKTQQTAESKKERRQGTKTGMNSGDPRKVKNVVTFSRGRESHLFSCCFGT